MLPWLEGRDLTFLILDESSEECTIEDERGITDAIAGAKGTAAPLVLGSGRLLGRKCLHALSDYVLIAGALPGNWQLGKACRSIE